MALRETDDGIPEFRHATVDYFQMTRLDSELDNEPTARFVTSQDNDLFGIVRFDELADVPVHNEEDRSGFFCTRKVFELPTGKIKEVRVVVESQVISEVHITMDADRISLFAGEVYEDHDLKYTVRFLDECVLVQVNGARPENMSFAPGV